MLSALSTFSGLTVDDLAKAKEFYGDTLGLEIKDEGAGIKFALPGGGTLFIYEKSAHKATDSTVLNFAVENIDETVEHLTTHGITFEHYDELPAPQDAKEILRGKDAGYGPNIAWFKDPAGNIISVLEE